MSSVAKRSKGRTVFVTQSPVTEAERQQHKATKAELLERNSDLEYALNAAREDYDNLELASSRKIERLHAVKYKVGAYCVALGVGLGSFLQYIAW